ncbi:MAG: N-acetylmuramoyl-L-alanine amidase [Alphaproteobacteria bacterium]
MKIFLKFLFFLIIYNNQAYSIELVNLRFGSNEEKKRIVLDLTSDTLFDYKIQNKKILITFKEDITINKNIKTKSNLQSVSYNKKEQKLSLSFKKSIYSTNIYLLKKKKNNYSRIVIDFSLSQHRKKTIIIDPGHGGKDSGAVGLYKKKEKVITLKVAKLLKQKFESSTNYSVILTRDTDKFLKLRTRTRIAKKNNADIFISLHADYHRNPRTRGISLYTLSENASDKEAAALARRENRSDLIDGVDLSSETSEVTSILLDLTKRETLNQSSSLVNYLIKSFRKDMNLLQRTHRYAGFAVLKSLDIPSVLIEMGYLSNKKDSKLLMSNEYHRKLSDKIVKGVIDYFKWKDQNNK